MIVVMMVVMVIVGTATTRDSAPTTAGRSPLVVGHGAIAVFSRRRHVRVKIAWSGERQLAGCLRFNKGI